MALRVPENTSQNPPKVIFWFLTILSVLAIFGKLYNIELKLHPTKRYCIRFQFH